MSLMRDSLKDNKTLSGPSNADSVFHQSNSSLLLSVILKMMIYDQKDQ